MLKINLVQDTILQVFSKTTHLAFIDLKFLCTMHTFTVLGFSPELLFTIVCKIFVLLQYFGKVPEGNQAR